MTPTRETFGNVPHGSVVLFYCLTVGTLAVFAYGLWRRFKLWRRGVPIGVRELIAGNFQQIFAKLKPGFRRLLTEGLGQKRVRGRGLPSWAHVALFAGFMMLFLGTTLLELDHLASGISDALKFHKGTYYVIYEFTLDVFGVLFLAGCVLFFWRRTRRPASVGHRATDWYVIISFLAIGITGYLVEGLRIVWQRPTGIAANCSPVGLWISHWFSGMTEASARSAHLVFWWLHAALVFGFIASIPYTRLLHIIAGPLNLFFARPELGRMVAVSMEEVEKTERIGVSAIEHFNQQQLLSLDACMECGRCEEACPTFATAKPLSPKKVVQDLKALMSLNLTFSGSAGTLAGEAFQGQLAGKGAGAPKPRGLHEETIQPETLWSCTACSACVRVCPVRIDPLTLITDLRRNRVGEGTLSGTAATALRRMQSSGNPWGLPAAERANWSEGIGAPTVKENPDFEWLYWIGCAGSYDRRAQRVARAVVKLLKQANVSFAILGREEKCTGESARRLGDEFLFQELAQANIATLARFKVRKIITHCPHCLNSLLKDYPQFGGNYEVIHHTQFLERLLAEGRLKTDGPPSGDGITYHDPCYLARVNGIHESPRDALKAALGGASSTASEIREMPRNREKTFCCGAGGGRMWMEEDPKKRVCSLRAGEALATGAKTVAVGCPFCLTMMTDGVAAQSDSARVMDVAEILAERLRL